MNILSIDQSLINSGIAIYSEKELTITSIKPKKTGIDRLVEIQDSLETLIERYYIKIICMEDYAFSAKGKVFNLGELGGAVKLLYHKLKSKKEIYLLIIPIGVHKKYSTGRGDTKKNLMLKEVYKRYDIDTNDDNQADAVSMLKTLQGYSSYIQGGIKNLTSKQVEALKTLDSIVKDDYALYTFIKSN